MDIVSISAIVPPELAGYTWRPARREDAPNVFQVKLAEDEADGTAQARTLADMKNMFDDPWLRLDRDTLVAVAPDGALVAWAATLVNPEPCTECRAFLDGAVHPAHRGRGLGHFILSWMEAHAAQLMRDLHGDARRILRVTCVDTQLDRIGLFQQHGFSPIRYFFRMRRDLHQPIPEVELPAGITLRRYAPGLSEALRRVFNETFSDHWGFEPVSKKDWEVMVVGRPGFRPDLTLLAMHGQEIVGHSINRVSEEEIERLGIRQGWIGQLGVVRAWRKQGIASALANESMRLFGEQGLDYAILGVDAASPTGAVALYEHLGFFVVTRLMTFHKYLDAPEET